MKFGFEKFYKKVSLPAMQDFLSVANYQAAAVIKTMKANLVKIGTKTGGPIKCT